jgi:hypothetical protein
VALGRPHCMLVPVKPVPGREGDYIHHRAQVVYDVDQTQAGGNLLLWHPGPQPQSNRGRGAGGPRLLRCLGAV